MLRSILRNQTVRNAIPPGVKRFVVDGRLFFCRAEYHSQYSNVFHCCTYKTASQWVRKILSDKEVCRGSGLRPYLWEPNSGKAKPDGTVTVPKNRIVTSMYEDYEKYRTLGSADRMRAFFVLRDPRDVIVSWYFSATYSHPVKKNSRLAAERARLRSLSLEEGLIASIDVLEEFAQFGVMRSWLRGAQDESVKLVKFEELTGRDQIDIFQDLFRFCDIRLSSDRIAGLLRKYSFRGLSGRERGQEDINSKFRKGQPGDWKNHFTDKVEKHFREVTGPLVEELGYE